MRRRSRGVEIPTLFNSKGFVSLPNNSRIEINYDNYLIEVGPSDKDGIRSVLTIAEFYSFLLRFPIF